MRGSARLLGVAMLAVTIAGCGSTKTTATVPQSDTTSARIYLLSQSGVQPVLRVVPRAQALSAAWKGLMIGPTPNEVAFGLSSSVMGAAGWTIETSPTGDPVLNLATSLSRAALAQTVYTLTQFASKGPVIVNGRRYTRADFEAETPAILVESPLTEQTVANPLRMTGTANTFEATFLYELVDSVGKVIAKHFATATSGSGTRGTFDVTIPYPTGHGGPGKLVVYESSAKDGSRIHTVEIPLRLTG